MTRPKGSVLFYAVGETGLGGSVPAMDVKVRAVGQPVDGLTLVKFRAEARQLVVEGVARRGKKITDEFAR